MSALLQIVSLNKSFGARALLRVSNLVVNAGELVVLTGDNGSGKSTLLRILAGLEPADALQIRFGDTHHERALPDSLRREVVYIHQHPYLFNRSIADNIDYGLRLRKVDASRRRVEVAAAIRWAALESVMQVPPKRLSGGEKQKLALARAKVLSPRLWLIDEPTANLDRSAREQIAALLRGVIGSENALIVACHDQEIIDLPNVTRWHLEDGTVVSG